MIVLVLGGTRSGKSERAERIARELAEPVTYVATAPPATDGHFAARVTAHRDRRPEGWTTLEHPDDLAGAVADLAGTVVIDSLGAWIAARPEFAADVAGLCSALRARSGSSVLVSEEVGLGVHAPTELGVRFADALGECNRQVARVADRVILVVAGRALELPRDGRD